MCKAYKYEGNRPTRWTAKEASLRADTKAQMQER
jgi:hypothetical protein